MPKHKGPLQTIGVKVPRDLWKLVNELAEKNYRTLTAEVLIAIQKHLRDEGVLRDEQEAPVSQRRRQ